MYKYYFIQNHYCHSSIKFYDMLPYKIESVNLDFFKYVKNNSYEDHLRDRIYL